MEQARPPTTAASQGGVSSVTGVPGLRWSSSTVLSILLIPILSLVGSLCQAYHGQGGLGVFLKSRLFHFELALLVAVLGALVGLLNGPSNGSLQTLGKTLRPYSLSNAKHLMLLPSYSLGFYMLWYGPSHWGLISAHPALYLLSIYGILDIAFSITARLYGPGMLSNTGILPSFYLPASLMAVLLQLLSIQSSFRPTSDLFSLGVSVVYLGFLYASYLVFILQHSAGLLVKAHGLLLSLSLLGPLSVLHPYLAWVPSVLLSYILLARTTNLPRFIRVMLAMGGYYYARWISRYEGLRASRSIQRESELVREALARKKQEDLEVQERRMTEALARQAQLVAKKT